MSIRKLERPDGVYIRLQDLIGEMQSTIRFVEESSGYENNSHMKMAVFVLQTRIQSLQILLQPGEVY